MIEMTAQLMMIGVKFAKKKSRAYQFRQHHNKVSKCRHPGEEADCPRPARLHHAFATFLTPPVLMIYFKMIENMNAKMESYSTEN